jgi:BirA family biotin operon repressor/biotin-[acetyl-CoA-carboxylase] ligase
MQIPGRDIRWFPSLGSTMHEAARLAAGGCASGTAVVAGEQTAGMGRQGRSWHSEPGAGLYVSVVLRLQQAVLPGVMLALGLAAARAIERTASVACDLRWPNDVLLAGKKVAGILADLEGGSAVIAGIGINVNHSTLPAELRGIATSLRLETAREYDRRDVLAALLDAIDEEAARLAREGVAATIAEFRRASSYAEGRRVVVDRAGQHLEGTTAGLDPDGFLLVRTAEGRLERVLSGGVRPLD